MLTDLLKSGIGETIKSIGGLAKDVRVAITGKDTVTAEERMDLAAKLQAIEIAGMDLEKTILAGQLQVNALEAANPNLFVAGARPAILWVCAFVLFGTYAAFPILKACGVAIPEMDMSDLWPLMSGLLGLGGMRTYEKVKGVQGQH